MGSRPGLSLSLTITRINSQPDSNAGEVTEKSTERHMVLALSLFASPYGQLP